MQLPLFHTGNHARHQQRSTQYSPGRRFQRFLMGRSINKYDRIKSDRPKTSRTGIQSSPGSSIVDSESLSSHGHSRSSVPSRSHLSRSTSHSINHHLPPQISDRPAQQVSIPAQAHLVEHSPHADVADEEQGRRERGTHQLRRRKRRRSPIFSNKSWLLGRNPTTMKSKIISCILSGIFLTIMLSTCMYIYASFLYLDRYHQRNLLMIKISDIALTQSKPKILQSLHALFLLIIVTTTIFFCHCLVRLCMLALDKKASSSSSSGRRRRGTQTHHHDGHHPREGSASAEEGCIYPARPIPVITDVAVTDPETAKRPPPAYGHWRGSVVCLFCSKLQPEKEKPIILSYITIIPY